MLATIWYRVRDVLLSTVSHSVSVIDIDGALSCLTLPSDWQCWLWQTQLRDCWKSRWLSDFLAEKQSSQFICRRRFRRGGGVAHPSIFVPNSLKNRLNWPLYATKILGASPCTPQPPPFFKSWIRTWFVWFVSKQINVPLNRNHASDKAYKTVTDHDKVTS